MRKILCLIAILLIVCAASACSKVESGYVGVKVKLLGGDKGVDSEVLGPGRYYIGWNEDLFLYPTFQQNEIWSASAHEGKAHDESITFQSKEGLGVNADIGVSYTLDRAKVAELFQRFRKGNQEISEVYLRNLVRDSLNIEASTRSVEQLYGEGKADFLTAALKRVQNEIGPLGVQVTNLTVNGQMRLPQAIIDTMSAKIAATQSAIKVENQLRETQAEAKKKIAEAEGEATSITVRAAAQAKANQILAASITPTLVEYERVQKWDGKLPQVSGGATPFVNFTVK